ncbi:hypothetical protein B0A55_00886 [Friedmanniomyces simplex]|uniref:Mid2 domain-containing protein n=1 Tax=Friedmanniomyces simplex TaxID=329884 RepID=A0A4U0Y3Q9_9PEZI|nr:hypothetical protein B0A55_00886 [Friedmanniomyces simplex]
MPRIYSHSHDYSLRHAAIILILFLTAATAQTLRFTEPAANALTALGATTNYTLGEHVRVAWQSGYELTTLRVWQGPREDGSFGGKVLAGSAATTPAPPLSHSNRHALALGLGLGLGLGIPLLLALLALCAFCLLRRRKNQRRSANLPRGHQPNISISAPLMVQQDKPAGLPGSPGHPQIAYFGAYTPGRGDEARVDRSSTGTASTTASSYHGPFEFERPGSEPRFDARSIEREIQSIPRSAPHYPPSGRASSVGSGTLRMGTPRSDYNPGGAPRLSSIDEHGPPLRAGTPEWPLRS